MNKATIDKVKACVKEFRALLKRSGQNPRSRVTVELATLPSKYRSSPIARSRFKIVTAKTTVSELSDLRHTVKPAKNMWVVLSTKKKGGKEAWSSCPLFEPGAKPGVLTVEHTLKGGGVPARVTMARERQGGLFGPVQKALKGLEDAPKRGGMAWIKGHGWLTQRQQRDMLEAAKRKKAAERAKIKAEEVREAGQFGLFGLPRQSDLFVPKSVKMTRTTEKVVALLEEIGFTSIKISNGMVTGTKGKFTAEVDTSKKRMKVSEKGKAGATATGKWKTVKQLGNQIRIPLHTTKPSKTKKPAKITLEITTRELLPGMIVALKIRRRKVKAEVVKVNKFRSGVDLMVREAGEFPETFSYSGDEVWTQPRIGVDVPWKMISKGRGKTQKEMAFPKTSKPKGKIKLEPWPPKAIKDGTKGVKMRGGPGPRTMKFFLPETGKWYDLIQWNRYLEELGLPKFGEWYLLRSKRSKEISLVCLPRKNWSYNKFRWNFDEVTYSVVGASLSYKPISMLTEEQAGEILSGWNPRDPEKVPWYQYKVHVIHVAESPALDKDMKKAIKAYEKARK